MKNWNDKTFLVTILWGFTNLILLSYHNCLLKIVTIFVCHILSLYTLNHHSLSGEIPSLCSNNKRRWRERSRSRDWELLHTTWRLAASLPIDIQQSRLFHAYILLASDTAVVSWGRKSLHLRVFLLDLMVNAISVMLYYTTLKSLIDELPVISEQAGIFFGNS